MFKDNENLLKQYALPPTLTFNFITNFFACDGMGFIYIDLWEKKLKYKFTLQGVYGDDELWFQVIIPF